MRERQPRAKTLKAKAKHVMKQLDDNMQKLELNLTSVEGLPETDATRDAIKRMQGLKDIGIAAKKVFDSIYEDDEDEKEEE